MIIKKVTYAVKVAWKPIRKLFNGTKKEWKKQERSETGKKERKAAVDTTSRQNFDSI